jgi:hypothetical protein
VTIDLSLIRPRGRHRLTYWGRVVAYVRFRLYYVNIPFWVVVLFWGVTVAVSGFVAGWVWARAL